jgi:Ala-tRNA(Pro) deacylase
MQENQKKLLSLLEFLKIKNEIYSHDPVFTTEQARKVSYDIPGSKNKNLFLKDKESNLYLISIVDTKKVNLKKLANILNTKKLSFANENLLLKFLGVEPGSVTPFGLINDIEKKVHVIIDKELLLSEKIAFHPLKNNKTIVIFTKDFETFLKYCKNKITIINFDDF